MTPAAPKEITQDRLATLRVIEECCVKARARFAEELRAGSTVEPGPLGLDAAKLETMEPSVTGPEAKGLEN